MEIPSKIPELNSWRTSEATNGSEKQQIQLQLRSFPSVFGTDMSGRKKILYWLGR